MAKYEVTFYYHTQCTVEVDAYFLGMADIDGWEGSLEIFQEEYENLKAIVEDE